MGVQSYHLFHHRQAGSLSHAPATNLRNCQIAQNIEQLREDNPWTQPCLCHAIFVEGAIALATATTTLNGIVFDLRTSFLIFEGLFLVLWLRTLCQEHREMKDRISDNIVMPMTIVNPPPIQEITSSGDNQESAPSSTNAIGQTNLEMQAL
nr:cell number regulator 6-like [Ipomoea batatas]